MMLALSLLILSTLIFLQVASPLMLWAASAPCLVSSSMDRAMHAADIMDQVTPRRLIGALCTCAFGQ